MKKIASRKERLPKWFRQDIPDAQTLARLRYFRKTGVNTVCLEAKCPNVSGCLSRGSLAFMILGSHCTRNCQFCAVGKSGAKPLRLDKQEPSRILKVIKEFRLNFVIITSVTRDDLDDYGAGQFCETIKLIRNYKKDIRIEILIPDFFGFNLKQVVLASPDVLAHNLETVPRLYSRIRKGASYGRSLQVFDQAKKLLPDLITKSSLLLGMGEEEEEVIGVMHDLLKASCDILVLGQYLRPMPRLYPVREFVSVEKFKSYKDIGLNLGFRAVLSSPLARTSYKAEQLYNSLMLMHFA